MLQYISNILYLSYTPWTFFVMEVTLNPDTLLISQRKMEESAMNCSPIGKVSFAFIQLLPSGSQSVSYDGLHMVGNTGRAANGGLQSVD